MMKERFARLLLGEDMSGTGKGVCTALAISNAITNLYATVFDQMWMLKPLADEKKSMWRREMEWLVSVCDHVIELMPSWQAFPDGTKLEVMTSRQRSDLYMNLPALRKLDSMLLEVLDDFTDTEFWYVDQAVAAADDSHGSEQVRKVMQRQKDKWWLPVPCVPFGGLIEETRKQLIYRRDCAKQILKAALAINNIALAEMEVPDSYLETLPKTGRDCLGNTIYQNITSEQFSPECLLDFLDLSTDHTAVEIANRVEASAYVWRRSLHPKPPTHPNCSLAMSPWEIVKDLIFDGNRNELLAERAVNFLFCLKQRFPGLSQTTLEASKIQCNKDVGKSVLESYSRVLESLAFNVVARIDDLLYVDDLMRQSDKLSSILNINVVSRRKMTMSCVLPASGTPYRTACGTRSYSPTRRTLLPSINGSKPHCCAFGVKRALSNYLVGDSKVKKSSNLTDDG
ncbi:hypothetical protein Leryth_007942 [Lithospermum erythrorhizon]|nr:hypothetical protein Leryth_007942 [Lithospermum erythrorhizon]